MGNTRLEFAANDVNEIKEIFSGLYEASGQNLDQYISGDSLTVPREVSDELRSSIKKYLTVVQNIVRQTGNIKAILETIDKSANCDRFAGWLEGYLHDMLRPYEDAQYLRESGMEQFEKTSIYVLENMILQNTSDKYFDLSILDKSQAHCFRKVMNYFIVRIIAYNDSREYIFDSMNTNFGIDADKCEVWWELVKNNEARLWKNVFMRKMNNIENKINQLLEYIEE